MTSLQPAPIDISGTYSRIAPAVSGVSVGYRRTENHASSVGVLYQAKINSKQGVLICKVSGVQYAIKGIY